MPTISPTLIPSKAPGALFSSLVGGDPSLNIRWLAATDPVFYEVLNRPIADVTVRQLVIAKAIDNLNVQLGHQASFPFLTTAKVTNGTVELDVPHNWIWDMQASIPKKWENLRLAKIIRISGTNSITGSTYTGRLRLVFTANIKNYTSEYALLYADYDIDSYLTFQTTSLLTATTTISNPAIDVGEAATVGGQIIFKTLDTQLEDVQDFLGILGPTNTVDLDNDGFYEAPTVYEISDSVAGGNTVSDDFSLVSMSHGTGLLTSSAYNSIPELDSDIQSWINTFNYPFDAQASLTSVDGIIIPKGMFREFDICAPAGDNPSGDTSGTYYPVWISRIERIGTSSSQLRFFFSTFNVTDTATGGQPSTAQVEFAQMDLISSYGPGEIVEITPINNLKLQSGVNLQPFNQHFGRGHAVLSNLWDGSTTTILDFFGAFDFIADNPPDTAFSSTNTRISSFGISRVPKYTPTIGQSRGLIGSTARRSIPIYPGDDNRYVVEQDQGAGDSIDLELQVGITPNSAIERFGQSGSLTHRIVRLVVNADQISNSDTSFYQNQILPRLRILLGGPNSPRNPVFGDFWFNGTRLMFFNGDTWSG